MKEYDIAVIKLQAIEIANIILNTDGLNTSSMTSVMKTKQIEEIFNLANKISKFSLDN